MNHVYRLIWNHATQSLVAVCETARGRGKNGGKAKRVAGLVASGALIFGVAGVSPVLAQMVTEDQPNGVDYPMGISGNFNNQARISTLDEAVSITGDVTGNLTNSGDIWSGDSHGVYISGNLTGAFTNTASGSVFVDSNAFEASGNVGSVVNAGSIDGSHGVAIGGALSGGFANTGALRTYGISTYVGGAASGEITNSGSIYSYESHGVFLSSTFNGAFTNEAGARLITNDFGFRAGAGTYDVTNDGDMFVSYGTFISASVTGTFTNSATGRLFSVPQGLLMYGGGFNIDFVNEGLIATGSHSVELSSSTLVGTLTNRGDMYSPGGGAFLLYSNPPSGSWTLDGDFTNEGTMLSNCDGLQITGSMKGDFVNTAGAFILGNQAVRIEAASNSSETMRGNFTNHGYLIGADNAGVSLEGDQPGDPIPAVGNFENKATGTVIGSKSNPAVKYLAPLQGNFTNAGRLYGGNQGAAGPAYFRQGITGNFVNQSTGLIVGNDQSGVVLGASLSASQGVGGNFTNAGLIIANAQQTLNPSGQNPPVTWQFIRQGSNAIIGSCVFQTCQAPGYVTPSPAVGVLIQGDVDGAFNNSGTIIAAQGVFITGDLTGGWNNTGTILGGYGSLASPVKIISGADYRLANDFLALTGSRVLYGDTAVIGGNYAGNFTTGVGQGIRVGSWVHDWETPDDLVPENQVTVSLQSGTGTADLTGDTVAVHVGSGANHIDGDTWTGITAGTITGFSGTVLDNSENYNFSAAVASSGGTDRLVFTIDRVTGSGGSALYNLSDVTNLRYTQGGNSFSNAAGALVLGGGARAVEFANGLTSFTNAGRVVAGTLGYSALYVSGDLAGNFTNTSSGLMSGSGSIVTITGDVASGVTLRNEGEMINTGSYGVVVSGDFNGNFTNAAGAVLYAANSPLEVRGQMNGNITNAGSMIGSSNSGEVVRISGGFHGNFTNTGRMYGSKRAVEVIGDYGSTSATFANSGEIVSTDCAALTFSRTFTGSFSNAAGGRIFSDEVTLEFKNSNINSVAFSGSFSNAGTIASLDCDGIRISGAMSGSFTNSADATIFADELTIRILGDVSNGNFANAGEIISRDSHAVYVGGVLSGNFSNAAGALIWANENGVQLQGGITGNGGLTGNVTNAGEIAAGDHGIYMASLLNGSFTNASTGVINSTESGVFVSGSFGGDFTNQGHIRSTECHGVAIQGLMNGDFTNSAGALILGKQIGVVVSSGLTGDFNNAGSIYATGSNSSNDGVFLKGAFDGSFKNSGVIGSYSRGLFIDTSSMTGEYTNSVNGQILAMSSVGVGVYVESSGVAGTINNAGLIAGGYRSLDLQNSAAPITVNNTGTLQGDVYLGLNTLNLNGNAARVIGNTRNTGGTVNVNGDFTSEGIFDVNNFNIASAGTFRMRHAVGGVNQAAMTNQGVLDLGNAARSLTGTYTQGGAATLGLTFTDSSNYGKLNATGNATLASGGTINVNINGAPPARIDGVVTSGGTLSATGLTVTDNSVLYDFTISTTRNAAELDLVTVADPDGITTSVSQATNPGVQGVAAALQTMFNNGIPAGMQPLFNLLTGLSESELASAMNQLVPTVQGAADQAGLNALRSMNKIVQARIESNQGLSSGDNSAERYLWARTFGSQADQGDIKGVPGFKSRSEGIVVGGDAPMADRIRVGGAFTYARSGISSRSVTAPSNVDVDTYELVGYASYNIDERTDANFQVDAGINQAKSARQVFGGGVASAKFDSLALHGSAGIGRVLDLSSTTNVTPSLRLDYSHMRTAGYTESGATIAGSNLRVDSSAFDELLFTVDGKLTHRFDQKNKFIGNITLGYDALNKPIVTNSSFVGGGPNFQTQGLETSPWLHRLGLGFIHNDQKGLEYNIRFDLEGRPSGYQNQTLSARMRWQF